MTRKVYAQRDDAGKIVSISMVADSQNTEHLPADSDEVIRFIRTLSGEDPTFATSDLGFVRVLDDLITLLIEKDVINFTDLPEAARDKVLQRQTLRGLKLLADEEDETI